MFTSELSDVFEAETEEGRRLFDLLQHAYINVRYKDRFAVDRQSLIQIVGIINRLVVLIESISREPLFILEKNKPILS